MGNYCVLCKEQHESDGKKHTHSRTSRRANDEKSTETHTQISTKPSAHCLFNIHVSNSN